MVEGKPDLATLKQSIHHHRIAVFSIVVFLVLLTFAVIALSKSLLPSSVITTGQPAVKKEPKVPVKKEYENPFDKNTQYVNPFSTYKNPFNTLK